MKKTTILKLICFIVVTVFVISCGGGSSGSDSTSDTGLDTDTDTPSPKKTATISWTANRESGVNSSGGGYKVYYSKSYLFDASSTESVDVPYVSGATAPTTTDIELSEGFYYIKVVAYSAINTEGSESSDEINLEVTE